MDLAPEMESLSDGPLENIIMHLDCHSVCRASTTWREGRRITSGTRFLTRLAKVHGFEHEPAPSMVDARVRSFHLDAATLIDSVERLATLVRLREIGRNDLTFHLATLSPVRRSERLVQRWANLLIAGWQKGDFFSPFEARCLLVSRSVFTRFDSLLDERSSLVEFSKCGPFP